MYFSVELCKWIKALEIGFRGLPSTRHRAWCCCTARLARKPRRTPQNRTPKRPHNIVGALSFFFNHTCRAAKHQEDVEAAQVRERARLAALRLEGEAAAAAAAAAGRAHTSGAALASTSTGNGTSSGKTAAAPGGGGGVAPERERDELEAQFISSEVAEVRAKLPREGQRERLRSATEDCVQVGVRSGSRVWGGMRVCACGCVGVWVWVDVATIRRKNEALRR